MQVYLAKSDTFDQYLVEKLYIMHSLHLDLIMALRSTWELAKGTYSPWHIQPLAVTQNKLLRILQFKARKTPLKSLCTAFDVIKLKDLHYLNICCIVHKFIYSPCLLPEAINDIFRKNKQVHQYDTRQKNDLHPVKINTRLYGEKTISFQGRDYWNKLPSSLKKVTSAAVFKRKLKHHILDNYWKWF